MGITAVCESCGKKFQAPDRMAGKRVKCRGCGTAFTLPGGAPAAVGGGGSGGGFGEQEREGNDWETQAGGFGFGGGEEGEAAAPPMDANFAPTRRGGVGAPMGEHQRNEDEEMDAPPPRRRSNWYRHPFVKQLDHWLPPGAAVMGLLWLLISTWSATEGLPTWVFGVRMAVILGCYIIIVAPLSYVGVRYAIKSMGMSVPKDGRWRAFTAYMPAVTLGVVLWNVGAGGTPALIMGTVLGLAISAGALMVLFRFEPEEIGPTALYASGGFVFGAFVCGMMIWGVNLLAMRGFGDMKLTSIPDGPNSPMWSYMTWEVPKPEKPPAKPTTNNLAGRPAPIPGAPGTPVSPVRPGTGTGPTVASLPGNTGTTPGANPGSGDPTFITPLPAGPDKPRPAELTQLVASRETMELNGKFETVLRPAIASSHAGVARKGTEGGQLIVESWDTAKWSKEPTGNFSTAGSPSGMTPESVLALAPKGDKVAYFATFPRPSIQFWHFTDGRGEQVTDIEKGGAPTFVGFVNESRLVYLQDSASNTTMIRWFDSKNPEQRKEIDLGVQIPRGSGSGTMLAVSPNGRTIAVVARKNGGDHMISLYDIGAPVPSPIEVKVNMDRDLAITPAGLAFSPDGSQIAIYYEWNGSAVLLIHSATTGTQQKEWLFPASPLPSQERKSYQGSAIAWFPSGRAFLLFGDAVIDGASGRAVGRLNIPGVAAQRFVADDVVDLMVDDPNRKVVRVKVNLKAIPSMAPPGMAAPAGGGGQ